MMNERKVMANASWIIGLQIVKAILSFIISMLTARYLGPSDFGLINYASSIVSFVAPVMYLGLNCVLVQEFVSNSEKEGETIGTAVVLSLSSSLLCIGGIVSFAAIANRGETETIIVCALYSILLIFQSADLVLYWFQANLLSKYSSIASLCSYGIVSAYKIFLLITHKGVRWFAISSALDYFAIAVILMILYHKLGGRKMSFSRTAARRMLKKSKYYIIADMMVAVFAQTDRIMLKLMIDDAATGYYSAAVSCSVMTGFVFSAIIDSFRPLIFENKQNNNEKYEENLSKLYSIIIYLSLIQSVFITIFARLIIGILCGSDYEPSIEILRLVVWYTTFSYLGSVRNIWMLAENKQKYLWFINLCGALSNIILNYILIPFMGCMGAALASLITQFFTNVIIGFIMKPIRYNNKIMLRSLDPRLLASSVRSVVTAVKARTDKSK